MQSNFSIINNELSEIEFHQNGNRTVLAIDDNSSFLEYLRAVVSKDNHHKIFIESDPFNAIKTFVELRPDIVFVDLNMPIINGMNLIKIINILNFYNSKIIILSANHTCQQDLKCIEEFKNITFAKKPIDINELKQFIEAS